MRALPVFFSRALACVLYVSGGLFFILKYLFLNSPPPEHFITDNPDRFFIFLVSFYVPYVLCFASWCVYILSRSYILRPICFAFGVSMILLQGYLLADFWTMTVYFYCAYIIICADIFSIKRSAAACAAMLCLFFFVHNGIALQDRITAFVFEAACAAFAIVTRVLSRELIEKTDQVTYLNETGEKMVLFNQKLQEYAKEVQETAVRNDRKRFTSDLHDSAGYVFTNIIALSEAAMSRQDIPGEDARETFRIILSQARGGLRKTREILHMIRAIPDSDSAMTDTIYTMKKIFEEVMRINVEVDTGNIKNNYGQAINGSVARVIQESFTNSIRHGYATRIHIQLWERYNGFLTMTISDNGKGTADIVKGIGLAGMEERVSRLGGVIDFYCPEDGGFRINVEIPLSTQKEPA